MQGGFPDIGSPITETHLKESTITDNQRSSVISQDPNVRMQSENIIEEKEEREIDPDLITELQNIKHQLQSQKNKQMESELRMTQLQ